MSISKKLSIGVLFPSYGEQIWPEGYSVTSHYLGKALKRHTEVNSVIRVGTRDFGKLKNKKLDLVISLDHGFGNNIFKLDCLKFMWWLTPNGVNPVAFSIQEVINSKYDGIFSCSPNSVYEISKYKPCIYLPLAVDKNFRYNFNRKYNHNIVYMGTYPFKENYQYDLLFEPAIKYGLVIYGNKGWKNSKYSQFYKGMLPFEDINKLYSSAKIVLAMTKKEMMDLSMIPNRLYEALSCNAIVVAEYYPELLRRLGGYILLVKNPVETEEYFSYLLSKDDTKAKTMAQMGKEWSLTYQTYDNRVKEIIDFYKEIRK